MTATTTDTTTPTDLTNRPALGAYRRTSLRRRLWRRAFLEHFRGTDGAPTVADAERAIAAADDEILAWLAGRAVAAEIPSLAHQIATSIVAQTLCERPPATVATDLAVTIDALQALQALLETEETAA